MKNDFDFIKDKIDNSGVNAPADMDEGFVMTRRTKSPLTAGMIKIAFRTAKQSIIRSKVSIYITDISTIITGNMIAGLEGCAMEMNTA